MHARSLVPSALVVAACALLACGDDDGPTDSPDATPPDVASADVAQPDAAGPNAPDARRPVPEGPIVETASGAVVGVEGDGFRAFLGIPYAAPPTGDLRYRAPVPHPPWSEPWDATVKGDACAQSLLGGSLRIGEEDCLFLNVHTPDPMPEAAPVLVWIHGGAFVLGEGLQTDGGTAGDVLAREEGIVVVSMNYRLGQLGFLAHPALAAEQPEGGSGNFGFLDQVAALRWVQDNIAAFGGDPTRVTIAGESAGGMSVCGHLVSPASEGLFAQAILQSGPCERAIVSLETANAQGERFVREVGCEGSADVPGCLREAPLSALRAALPTSGAIVLGMDEDTGQYRLVPDGVVLPGRPQDEIEAGRFHQVPVMTGWNRDEGTLFVALAELAGEPPIDEARYRELVTSAVGAEQAEAVFAQYPVGEYPDARYALAAALGHGVLACPARRTARALAGASDRPVFTYWFAYADAEFQLPLGSDLDLGAFHSAEIQFVFGHRSGGGDFDAEETALHEAMRGRWAEFVRAGDPGGTPAWPV
ncbi:MAG: carboxylesterase family protein, partial [Deltaproteobacteria bacterium]|nr:carboxylesterase family protein [Deltaproteobacteria bacterium]